MLRGAGEKFSAAAPGEDVQHHGFVGWIRRVAVALPVARVGIEFDAAAHRLAAIQRDRGLGEVRPGFAIPHAELHHAHALRPRGRELPPKIAGEPMRLQFELRRFARHREQRLLAKSGARSVAYRSPGFMPRGKQAERRSSTLRCFRRGGGVAGGAGGGGGSVSQRSRSTAGELRHQRDHLLGQRPGLGFPAGALQLDDLMDGHAHGVVGLAVKLARF